MSAPELPPPALLVLACDAEPTQKPMGYRATCRVCGWEGDRLFRSFVAALLDAENHNNPTPTQEGHFP